MKRKNKLVELIVDFNKNQPETLDEDKDFLYLFADNWSVSIANTSDVYARVGLFEEKGVLILSFTFTKGVFQDIVKTKMENKTLLTYFNGLSKDERFNLLCDIYNRTKQYIKLTEEINELIDKRENLKIIL